ncbi:FtsJ-like methyltransferase family protein [Metarhizium guizhouense ARSEF 977]|uniref:FtsJ-like methyltransferase family protein n=1 Tax=Metarhizium guizhouense (strain ARSEF 977) TaxID=1276136 RepID=A0A0B4GKW2_METGA|nr:FtsJ-like methyltransferase family protein [Metarhizium guizhouense ARSEF 977]
MQLDQLDINTLAGDMGFSDLPESSTGSTKFTTDRLLDQHKFWAPGLQSAHLPGCSSLHKFHVAICGCQVTRACQEKEQLGERNGPRRLLLAQLVIAMEQLENGGTLIAVLHKPESFHTAQILHMFSGFSHLVLFKPQKVHAKRSSFYMVARRVQSRSDQASEAVRLWKKEWFTTTFGPGSPHKLSRKQLAAPECDGSSASHQKLTASVAWSRP